MGPLGPQCPPTQACRQPHAPTSARYVASATCKPVRVTESPEGTNMSMKPGCNSLQWLGRHAMARATARAQQTL
eukprot:1548815-Lingulodinium_polyedra.AAC.1